jgi:hypothetical protein
VLITISAASVELREKTRKKDVDRRASLCGINLQVRQKVICKFKFLNSVVNALSYV